ncbi:MAG: nucleotide sugar dehydrogenase [Planctomycetota bacterium]
MSLNAKIKDRSAVVGVMALGYVGLPLIRTFFDAGFRVIGFDVDPRKIEQLERGENYLKHLGEDFVREMASSDRFEATADMSRLGEADAILVCVPTPLGQHLEPDLSYVEQTARDIAKTLRPDQLIVLESTTYPGTTRKLMAPPLDAAGVSYHLAYSPEREDPGRKDHNTQTIPKLVGGVTPEAGELAVALYRTAIKEVVPVSSAEVAEAAKILENVYRSVNIALVNELKVILTAMGVDVWEVIDAAKTKPFGFQAFYPGPGLGGHCIPIDPFYLTWAAREHGQTTRFIELAGQVNHEMPGYVVQRSMLALNDAGKAIRDARILVLGLAYKPDIDDVRESPSFELIEQLLQLGGKVDYHDPHVPETHAMRHYPDLPPMQSIELTEKALAAYDLVLIATHHSSYDWEWIGRHARLIVDTRGALRGTTSAASVVNA